MNYQEFRAYRDRVTSGASLVRLDCMNPAKALSREFSVRAEPGTDLASVAERWNSLVLGPRLSTEGRTALTCGVRQALDRLMAEGAQLERQVWLPLGVYPEYWALAARHRVDARRYDSLPTLDLDFLERADESAWAVVPHPLVPEGRPLTTREISKLASWLRGTRRILVLDCAYALDLPVTALAPILETGRAVLLHSLSKGWLSPGTLGAAHLPHALDGIAFAPPSGEALSRAASLLSAEPLMPRRVEEILTKRWLRLSAVIRRHFNGWNPPETGYFSILPASSTELLTRHSWLAIPCSVFGSDRAEMSVITCLFYGEDDPLP